MRCITFKLPAGSTNGVELTLSEQPDGTIRCEMVAYGAGKTDVRGLFFDVADSALLASLSITGTGVANTVIGNDSVRDLGNGINMNGSNGGVFDAGISFGKQGVTSSVLTFASSAGALTLDDFAHVDFGARFGSGGGKATALAPAAPNAFDDAAAATEDVQAAFSVLTNDTDADGQALFITAAADAPHGTVTISADGHSIIYTADPNYSGSDTFTYTVSDGNGGKDTATVTVQVAAVADTPDADVVVSAGADVQQIRLRVSSAVTDTDGSEFIDRIEFTGLPPGASILEAPGGVYDDPGNPGSLVRDFTLVLQAGQNFDFDLGIRTFAREVSNGSEAFSDDTVHVEMDTGSFSQSGTYHAINQSIWSSGSEFVIDDERFIGINPTPIHLDQSFGPVEVTFDAALKVGLNSDLHFEGGDIDATLPYDITISSSYNRTTDVLALDAAAVLNGGSFNTQGPTGSYQLDFIFEYLLGGSVQLDFGPDFLTWNIYDDELSGDHSRNLIDIDSNSSTTINLPFGIDGTIAWPNVTTTSGPGLTSQGTSNDFLHINVDIDQAFSDIFLGGINPFDIDFDLGAVWGNIQLLDADLFGGLNFVQNFELDASTLTGNYIFENGAIVAFDTANPLQLTSASSYDTDGDGMVEFQIELTPQARLRNNTDLGIDIGFNFDLLKIDGRYDVLFDEGGFHFGPLVDLGGEEQVATIDLYDQTFGLTFTSQTFAFAI